MLFWGDEPPVDVAPCDLISALEKDCFKVLLVHGVVGMGDPLLLVLLINRIGLIIAKPRPKFERGPFLRKRSIPQIFLGKECENGRFARFQNGKG